MNLVEKTDIQLSTLVDDLFFAPKLLKLAEAKKLTKKLVIGIYLIDSNQFIYFNKGVKNLIGKDTNRILKEGWGFWFSLIKPDQKNYIKNEVYNFFTFPYVKNPPTLHYTINNAFGKSIAIKHEIIIHKFINQLFAVNFISHSTKKEKKEAFFETKSAFFNYNSKKKSILKISKREKEVLGLIGNGYSSKQIAEKLFISNHTAISHRKNLIEKFHVKNTAHLIKKASGVMDF